jgi:poly-gamma-glutamate capsule biosynthesis protein CapA/YwtB (metallophosphatase superfamily)
MAVGDIMLGRTIGEMIRIEGPGAPFQYTADTLASADITLGNLECTISTRGMPADKAYTFRAPPEAAQSLTLAGFDLVSLANNHSLDYGIPAFQDTLAYLSKEGILTVGGGLNEAQAYSPVFIEKEGLRVAFLAYAEVPLTEFDYLSWVAGPQRPGIAWVDHEILARDVRIARTEADVVVVLFHNGYEGMQKPAWIQQSSARLAVDSGASLVIGSHPHVLQPIESYGDGLIVYSMGNFVFDNFLFPPNYSAILEVELTEQGVERYSLIDVIVQLNGIPKIEAYDLDT